jgi:hypothetical protein
VVVVASGAASVGRLAVALADGVQLARVGHQLQGPVDGGEADAVSLVPQLVVDLLRAPELLEVGQDPVDRRPLPRLALRPGRGCGLGRLGVSHQCSS